MGISERASDKFRPASDFSRLSRTIFLKKGRFWLRFGAKEVVSGDNAHPFYLWAKKTLGFGTAPKWNFHKYLINRQGQLVDYYNSMTKPDSDKVTRKIEELLKEPAS